MVVVVVVVVELGGGGEVGCDWLIVGWLVDWLVKGWTVGSRLWLRVGSSVVVERCRGVEV
jgi:hypothetical protein